MSDQVGAVVVGGDYQGLGIARSLGRRGIPVCVIDDERSISRYSRYTTYAVRVASLRTEEECVDALLDVGKRLKLDGWVLYPTREETVAAFSRCRERLAGCSLGLGQAKYLRAGTASRCTDPADLVPERRQRPRRNRCLVPARDQAGDQRALPLRHQGQGLEGEHQGRTA